MKISFKKIACLGLALVTTLSLAACGGSEPNSESSVPDNSTSVTTKPIVYSEDLLFEYLKDSNSYAVVDIGSCTDTEINIPRTHQNLPVTQIADEAFLNCKEITSVIIPDTVTSIGINAFNNCTELANIEIPNSVTTIGYNAFIYCDSLTSLTLPASLRDLGEGTFRLCDGLESVTLSHGITTIESDTFRRCKGLTTITIPVSVKTIKENAFYYCFGLKNIYYEGTMAQWNAIKLERNCGIPGYKTIVYCTDGNIIL